MFSLTLIKVHLASKCCGPLNTDCTEKTKWKQKKDEATGGERKSECVREGMVEITEENNGLMMVEDGQNNHGGL